MVVDSELHTVRENYLKIFAIPYSAIISIVFGLMLISFPIGAFLVFESDMGGPITFEYPTDLLQPVFQTLHLTEAQINVSIGDVFLVFWCSYMILFSIAVLGPRHSFVHAAVSLMTKGKNHSRDNYLTTVIVWFTILVLVSALINFAQENFGMITEPPVFDNKLKQFVQVSISPAVEEIGFRVILIGVPLIAMFPFREQIRKTRGKASKFFWTLWNPSDGLELSDTRKVILVIVIVAGAFGVAHVFSDQGWSYGKVSQAVAAGIILGWVYVRYGLVPATLIHWSTNYLLFSYVFFVSYLSSGTASTEVVNPFLDTLEMILLLAGILSVFLLCQGYFRIKGHYNNNKAQTKGYSFSSNDIEKTTEKENKQQDNDRTSKI